MTIRIHFLYRIDMWSRDGERVTALGRCRGFQGTDGDLSGRMPALARQARSLLLSQGARAIESPVRLRQEA
jgi:hypothetical protein